MKDFDAIQHHIRAARLERSVALGDAIADLIVNAWRGAQRLAAAIAARFGDLKQQPESLRHS